MAKRKNSTVIEKKHCNCGCGQEIVYKEEHRKKYNPKYHYSWMRQKQIHGHSRKNVKPWNYGIPCTEERKQLIIKNAKKNPNFGMKGKKHSEETRRRYCEQRIGENAPGWKGGLSVYPYPKEFNEELKEQIRERDERTCQGKDCGISETEHMVMYGQRLTVHHIDYEKENCNEVNLITLCGSCNVKANYNRKYWEEYYTQVMIRKIKIPEGK